MSLSSVELQISSRASQVWRNSKGRLGRALDLKSIQFLFLVIQFAAAALVIERFRLENSTFRIVVVVCFAVFLVHYWLPSSWQLLAFLALSLASIFIIFGMYRGTWSPWLAADRGGWLLGLGVSLLAISHLPIALWLKVPTLALAGVTLGWLRASGVATFIPAAIWPILGSMFMFRLIIYVFDLYVGKQKTTVAKSLTYAFLVPNACFPLFPVIDFKTLWRTYFDGRRVTNYQIGLCWIMRGVVQLLIYRVLYYYYYLDSSQVINGTELVVFVLVNYLLYLRVSGQFHLIVGLLRLFGFNLPETHHRYLLATSFTDYWRRVNIYWRVFLMKVFYFPLMFRMKRWNQNVAMITATLIAFLVTWWFHSYQWFWLRGRFLLAGQDVLFWGTLALLVTLNSLWEAKRGRRRAIGSMKLSPVDHAIKALKTAGTFFTMAVLWSLWSSKSIDEWCYLMSLTDGMTLLWGLLALLVVMGVSLIPERFWPMGAAELNALAPERVRSVVFRQGMVTCLLPALMLLMAGRPRVQDWLGPGSRTFFRSLMEEVKPTEGDTEVLERGYYEELIDVGLQHSPLSEVYSKRPAEWKRLEETNALQLTGDYRLRDLAPSREVVVNGITYRTNRRGMRDRDYPLKKPVGAYRLAIIGASYAMGWGVEQEQSFEALLEQALEGASSPSIKQIEILNFGVNGYSPICQLVHLEKQVLRFQPDAVIYVAHGSDPFWTINRLARAARDSVPIPGEFPARVISELQLRPRTPLLAGERLLSPKALELVAWSYREMANQCKRQNVTFVWTYVPKPGGDSVDSKDFETLESLAKAAGCVTLDLRHAYGNTPASELTLAAWDLHPNARGHRLLAGALETALTECPALPLHQIQKSVRRLNFDIPIGDD